MSATALDPREQRLLLLLNALTYDGGKTRFLSFAETLRRRGGDVTIVAGSGPLEERAAACAHLRLVDWRGRRPSAEDVALEEAGRCTAVLVGAQPRLLHLIPRLASAAPVHLCLHAVPGVLEEDLSRYGPAGWLELLHDLHASGRVLFTGACELESRAHAERLGLPEGAIAPWPNGVPVPERIGPVSTGPIRRVTVLARLVPVKLPIIAAAAELVAAGRAAGRDVVLDVHGAGKRERDVRSLLAARLPAGGWRLHGETDRPLDAMRRADVVVATGRTSIEALIVGRRLVPVDPIGERAGLMGPPATPTTFDLLLSNNFCWRALEPVAPEDVWRQLEALDHSSARQVMERTRRECCADAMLDRELRLLSGLVGPRTSPRQRTEAQRESGAPIAATDPCDGVRP